MSDLYREILIQRKTPASNKFIKGTLITLTALMIVAGLAILPLLIPGFILGVVSYFVIPKLDVEYEYLYVNGELDIDAIYSKQKRKKVASYDMEELEILAPSNSHELDGMKNRPGAKVQDYTSGDPQAKSYIMVVNKEKGQEMAKLELDDVILNDIRRIAPRKVKQY